MINTTQKSVNYTPQQIDMIKAAAPLNYAKAQDLAQQLGKSTRSIIAKALSLRLPYDSKKPARKNGSPVVKKADLVKDIATKLNIVDIDGLAKAPRDTLIKILAA